MPWLTAWASRSHSLSRQASATSHSRLSWRLPAAGLSPCSGLAPSCAWPLCGSSVLFLAKDALRIEVADAAAFAAGCRVDHRIDESRLAGIQGPVDGALELVGRRHISANAAERFHHLVVARPFDEDGRRRV